MAPTVGAVAAPATSSRSPRLSARSIARLHDLDQLRPHPGPAVAVGQIHQHVVALSRPGARVVVHRRQRGLQQLDRSLVRVHLAGLGGRDDRGAPGPVRVRRAGREPVQRQLALPTRPAGQRLGHLGVQPGPTGRRDLGVRRVADQRVREAEPVDAVLADQPGLLRRLQRVEHRVLVETRARGQHGEIELPADHRGQPQHRPRRVRQPGEPAGQHVVHRGRRVRLGQQPAQVTPLRGQPRVLDQEERVAVGPLQQCVGFGTGRPRHHEPLHDVGGLVGAEPGELDPQRVRPGQHLGHVGQRTGRRRMRPPGAEHHQGVRAGHSRSAAAAPAATRRPPSADRPRSTAAADHRHASRTAATIPSQTANWET